MPSQPDPWKVYKQALAPFKFGDALWEPSPIYSYTRIRIGDVGYIRRGRFHLLFSAGIPLGSRTRGIDVPQTFKPLSIDPIILGGRRPPGYLRTDTVQQIGVDVGGEVAVACSVEPGVKMAFELTHKQGAGLITQHPTWREEAERDFRFKKYIKQHYDSWVDFALEQDHGDDIKPILVTGVHLTREFAMFAYTDNRTRMQCEFSAEVPTIASASVSVWGSWNTQGLVHSNCGPHYLPTQENQRPSEQNLIEQRPSEQSPNQQSPSQQSPSQQSLSQQNPNEGPASRSQIPDGYDQCVFVSYYKYHKPLGLVPRVVKAGAGPHQLPPRDPRDDGATSNSDGDSVEADYPETGSPPSVIHNVPVDDRDSFDIVAEFICQRTNATSVLLHHRDIQDFLHEDEKELPRLLEESGIVERVEIDESGVGYLVGRKENKLPDLAGEDSDTTVNTQTTAIQDDARVQILSTQTRSPASTIGVSGSGSRSAMDTKSQRQKRLDSALPLLNAAINDINLANKVSSIAPAKAVYGSVGVLLTMIKHSMVSNANYVELGLACADVCRALERGMNGRKFDDLSWPVREAIEHLKTSVAEIQRKVVKQSGWNLLSQRVQAKSERETMAAWRSDLGRILLVFNTELAINTHSVVAGFHHPIVKFQEEISDQVRSMQASLPPGESVPPPPRACFGRDELVEEIVGLVEDLVPIALIGPQGIGKTTIALTVLHDDRVKKRFGDNRRFIRCDQFPVSLTHFLGRLSKVVGAGIENPEELAPLRPFLSSKEIFIVLDSAESILDPQGMDAWEIYAVVEELGQFNNICLCITSDISTIPSACEFLDIPTLSMDAACNTFYRIYKHDERSDPVNNILRQLDFHPLSVTLLATVAHHNKWDTNRLIREWERRRTDILYTKHSQSLAATVELLQASPTFQELGPDARGLLGVVAFFPQGIDEKNIDWLFPTISNGIDIFDKFCMLSLTYRSNGFVTILTPFRDYLCPKDPTSSPLLCVAKECYFNRLSVDISPGKPGFEDARWITSEDVNVERLLEVFTSTDANSDDVWDACCRFMDHLRWHKPRLTALEPKIRELPDDHLLKPQCLFGLSQLFESVGNYQESRSLQLLTLELWRMRGRDSEVAEIVLTLSETSRKLDLYQEGAHQARESCEMFRQPGSATGEERPLRQLAPLYSDNQLELASPLTNESNQRQECQLYRALGHILQSQGKIEKAVDRFQVALAIATYWNWNAQQFWILHDLVELFCDEGMFDDASAHVERAKLSAADDTYLFGRVMELQGTVWYEQHRLGEAKSEVVRAVDVYEKLGMVQDLERCKEFLQVIEAGESDSSVTFHQPSSLHVHPLFAYSRLHHAPIQYDVCQTPSARTVLDCTTHSPVPAHTLAQPATDPPTAAPDQLVLRSHKFPWTIIVKTSSVSTSNKNPKRSKKLKRSNSRSSVTGTVITNLDVLYAIHTTLLARVTPEEWEALGNGSKAQRKVTRAYEKRCSIMGGWEGGVRRVDWLGGKTHLTGIEVEKSSGNSVGKLVFARIC